MDRSQLEGAIKRITATMDDPDYVKTFGLVDRREDDKQLAEYNKQLYALQRSSSLSSDLSSSSSSTLTMPSSSSSDSDNVRRTSTFQALKQEPSNTQIGDNNTQHITFVNGPGKTSFTLTRYVCLSVCLPVCLSVCSFTDVRLSKCALHTYVCVRKKNHPIERLEILDNSSPAKSKAQELLSTSIISDTRKELRKEIDGTIAK
jgi:hypothetical protein